MKAKSPFAKYFASLNISLGKNAARDLPFRYSIDKYKACPCARAEHSRIYWSMNSIFWSQKCMFSRYKSRIVSLVFFLKNFLRDIGHYYLCCFAFVAALHFHESPLFLASCLLYNSCIFLWEAENKPIFFKPRIWMPATGGASSCFVPRASKSSCDCPLHVCLFFHFLVTNNFLEGGAPS